MEDVIPRIFFKETLKIIMSKVIVKNVISLYSQLKTMIYLIL